jgi:glycosyltransferase involved in cell wall biosynthesis
VNHLLLIHQAFASLNDTGGTRHFEFAKHLVGCGDRVTVVTSGVNYQTAKPTSFAGKTAPKSGEPYVLCAPSWNLPHGGFIARVIGFITFMVTSIFIALRVRDVDIVMGTSPPIFQAFSAYVVARLKRKPFLLEIRDLWPDFAVDIGVLRNSVLIRLARAAERFLYNHADHLLVNSPAYVAHIAGKGIPERKVSLIPNGVNPEMYSVNEDAGAIRKRHGLDGRFVVTYAGALGMANDLSTILRSAARFGGIPDLVFVFAGAGRERPALEAQAHEMGLKNVVFLGALAKSEIPNLLAASDVCIATLKNIPMFRKTYPNKVFDYLAAGRPVVLAIDGVIREVVERGQAGIFAPPGDDEAIARAIETFRQDPALRARMGTNGRTFVSKYFNRRDHAMQFRELLAAVRGQRAT